MPGGGVRGWDCMREWGHTYCCTYQQIIIIYIIHSTVTFYSTLLYSMLLTAGTRSSL